MARSEAGTEITVTRKEKSGFKWWWMMFGGKDPSGAPSKYAEAEDWDESLKLLKGTAAAETVIEDEDFVPDAPAQGAGIFASTFNLCNVCLGAGTLSMPFAFKSVGVIFGFFLLTLVYVLMAMSGVMICEAARKLSATHTDLTYGGIMRAVFGPKGTVMVQIIIMVSTLGIGIAYFQLVGDLIAPPIGVWMGDTPEDYCSAWASRHTPMYFAIGVEAILCALPTLHALRYVSLVAVISMLFMSMVIVIKSGSKSPDDGDSMSWFEFSKDMFRTVSIITFAFAPHIQIVQMYGEFRDPTPIRVKKWIWSSLTICWAVYGVVGYFGYYAFYSNTKGNVLLNFTEEADDISVIIGRLGVALSVLAGYPTMCQPCVASLDKFFFPDREVSLWGRRLMWVAFYIGFTFAIAYLIDDVSIVLGLTGAGGLTGAAFLLPAAVTVKLSKEEGTGYFGTATVRWACAIFVLGLVFGAVAVGVNIEDAINPEDDNCTWVRTCAPARCCPDGGTYTPGSECP